MALRMGALYDALLAERLSRVEADLLVLKWMVGINIWLTVGVLGRFARYPVKRTTHA